MANIISDKFKKIDTFGRDFPIIKGDVRLTLKNVHNGKTEIYEKHNASTNALADIFAGNFGGLMNYDSFANIYNTWLGGVLMFRNALDPSAPNDYGIPSSSSNPVVAHAGQVSVTDVSDDISRGNPDSTGTVLTNGSTKLVWEWGTSQGNGTISSLGLTHTDVGSYGCGVVSQAQRLLNPFVSVACASKNYSYGDNANAVLAVDGNLAYNFYLQDSTTVNIYKTPINNTRFKLQGAALEPLTAYTQKIVATLPNSYAISSAGSCYYHFDFTNGKLILFGVPTEGGTTLYRDDIDLTSGNVTHSSITVTGANLWKFSGQDSSSTTGYQNTPLPVPTKAMLYDNHLYVYGNRGTGEYDRHPTKIFSINLANTADITEIDTTDAEKFDGQSGSRTNERFTKLGGIIIHDSFLINGGKVYPVSEKNVNINNGQHLGSSEGIVLPAFGINGDMNSISVSKLFLGSKWNLDSAITKNSSQSMTLEYTLEEI